MKIKLLTAAVAAFLLASGIEAHAQRAYAYGTAIDLQAGYAVTPYSVWGEQGRAFGFSDGLTLDFRLTHFFGRNLGGFAQIGIAETSSNATRYFNTVNRADGRRFKYDPGSSFYQSHYHEPVFILGPVWRQDVNNFSFRIRAGLGVAGYSTDIAEYARYEGKSDIPTFVKTEVITSQVDYLITDEYDMEDSKPKFVFSPSAQLTYSPIPHFYLSAEVGANFLPARVDVCTTTMRGKSIRDTGGWNDAVDYIYSILSDYVFDSSTTQVRIDNTSIGSMIYLTVGIGWDIGTNRNANGYYRK